MNEKEITALRNLMVMVIADGKVTDGERELIRRMREKLGVPACDFDRLCEQIRSGRGDLQIPSAGVEAEQLLRELMAVSTADGEMTVEEEKILERVGQFIDRGATEVEAMVGGTPRGEADLQLELQINERIMDIYAHFAQWSDAEKLKRCAEVAKLGSDAVIPILRVVESYRNPDGGGGLELKVVMVDQLAEIGDDRVVYYLAQQVSLGDTEDEVTCAALREAAAAAIGKIVGQPFTRDPAGVQACRRWWVGEGTETYRTLVL